MKKIGLIITVLELATMLVVKLLSHAERKKTWPRGGSAFDVGGRKVVNPSPEEYNPKPPTGEQDEIDLLGSGSAADKDVRRKR